MKKTAFTILSILFTILIPIISFSKDYKPITISGYFSDEALKRIKSDEKISGKPEIWYAKTFVVELQDKSKIIPIKIDGNKFSITIQPESEFGCIQFRGLGLDNISAFYLSWFHVEAGNSFSILINDVKGSYFTGKDAPKMNYQKYIGDLRNKGFPPNRSYKNPGFDFVKKQILNNIRMGLDSLNKIKPVISEKMYRLLRLETPSCLYFSKLNSMMFYLDNSSQNKDVDSLDKVIRRNELTSLANHQFAFPETDAFLIRNAFTYNAYLFQLNALSSKYLPEKNSAIGFESLYTLIKTKYSGLLRDQLITKTFLVYSKVLGMITFLPDALSIVKSLENVEILKQFSNARTPGKKAYNFSLEDAKGKKVTLEDLKGKLVVLDTWYNGCPGCIGLAKQMEPIMEHYKNNPSVVFLSVNVDEDRKYFLDGIKSGLYGTDQSLYLYTAGRGHQDPMLLHYQYSSYPNLLIIDKNGIVVSANPPLPFDEQRKKDLLNLIDKNI